MGRLENRASWRHTHPRNGRGRTTVEVRSVATCLEHDPEPLAHEFAVATRVAGPEPEGFPAISQLARMHRPPPAPQPPPRGLSEARAIPLECASREADPEGCRSPDPSILNLIVHGMPKGCHPFGVIAFWMNVRGYRSCLAQLPANGFEPFGFARRSCAFLQQLINKPTRS
jgi:hypothetical protein